MAACNINEVKTNAQLEEFLLSINVIQKDDLGFLVLNKAKIISEVKELGFLSRLVFEKEFSDQLDSREILNIKPFDYTFHRQLEDHQVDFTSVRESTEFLLNENRNLRDRIKELISKPEYLPKNVSLKDLYASQLEINKNIKELEVELDNLSLGVLDKSDTLEIIISVYTKLLSQYDYYLNQEGSFSWVQANNYDKAIDVIIENIRDLSSIGGADTNEELAFLGSKGEELNNLKQRLSGKKRDFLRKIAEGFTNPDKILELINEENSGLEDTDMFSQYFLSPDIGISGNQSIMSQILRGEITKSSNKQMSIANYLAKKMDKDFKNLDEYLKANDLTFLYSDQILKGGKRVIDQRKLLGSTKGIGGNNRILSRYTNAWFDWLSGRNNIISINNENFDKLLKSDKAFTYTTSLTKNITDQEAKFSKNNRQAIVITPLMLTQKKDELISLLGKREYDKIVKKSKQKAKIFSQMREVKEEEFKRNYPLGSDDYKIDLEEWDKSNNPNRVEEYLYTNSEIPHTFEFNEVIPNPHHSKAKSFIDQKYLEYSEHEPILDLLDSMTENKEFENMYNPDNEAHSNTVTLLRNDSLSKIAELFADKNFLVALYKLITKAITNPSKLVTLYKDILHKYAKDLSTNSKKLTTIEKSFNAIGLYNDRVSKSFMQNNEAELEASSLLILSELRKLPFDSNEKNGKYWKFASKDETKNQIGVQKGQINISENDIMLLKNFIGSPLSNSEYIEAIRNGTKTLTLEDIAKNLAIKDLLENSNPDIISAIKMKNLTVARYSASRAIEDEAALIKDQFNNLTTNNKESRDKDKIRFKEYYDRVFLLKDTKTQTKGFDRRNENKENFKVFPFLSNLLTIEGHRELTENIVNAIKTSRDTDLFPGEKEKLQKFISDHKQDMTLSDLIFALGKAFRFIGIGYSVRAGLNNMIEGSMTLAAASVYYDSLGIIDIIDVQEKDPSFWVGQQFSKNKTNDYIKMKKLLSMHDFLQDAANMIQLASGSKEDSDLQDFNPSEAFDYIRYTEKHVQYPLIYSLMKKTYLKGKDGTEVNMWKAIDFNENNELVLKDNFNTDENQIWIKPTIENINNANSNYSNLSLKVERMLSDTQGDFSDKGGMLIKSNPLGMLLMLFRTWWPAVTRSWFKGEHYDLFTDTIQKGKIKSTTGATGAAMLAIITLPFGGPIYAGISAAIGYGIGEIIKSHHGNIDISMKDDLTNMLKVTSKRGVNILAAPINAFLKPLFGKKIGFSDLTENLKFGETKKPDVGLLMSQYYSIAQAMAWGTVMMFIKAFFYDDDDEPDSAKRQAFNFFGNQAMNFYGQSVEAVNVIGTVSNMSKFPSESYIGKMFKVVTSTVSSITGNPINPTTGDYVMGEAMQKFVPGDISLLSQHLFGGGYGPSKTFYSSRNYGVNKWLQSSEKKLKHKISGQRKRYRLQQKDLFPNLDSKEIEKIVNRNRPTFNSLLKQGIDPFEFELYN